MEKVKDILVDYGGHGGAGGFSLLEENIHHLEERLNVAYEEIVVSGSFDTDGEVLIDKKISLDDVNWETWRQVEKFAPFGLDNPKPLFLFENIKISVVQLFEDSTKELREKYLKNILEEMLNMN
jgi:single-stranded-DNA-specific exonuclease